MQARPSKVGRRGMVHIPSEVRKASGIAEDSLVTFESMGDLVLIRKVRLVPEGGEVSREKIALMLLGNAIDDEDLKNAEREVRKLGLDPRKLSKARLPRK